MQDQNITALTGRLTADPEIKQTSTGKNVVEFSLAVNDGYGDNEHVSFFNCVAFKGLADIISKYAVKGSQAAITGKIRQERWESQDGQKRSVVKINVQTFQLVGKKTESTEQSKTPQQMNANPFNEDDIPF